MAVHLLKKYKVISLDIQIRIWKLIYFKQQYQPCYNIDVLCILNVLILVSELYCISENLKKRIYGFLWCLSKTDSVTEKKKIYQLDHAAIPFVLNWWDFWRNKEMRKSHVGHWDSLGLFQWYFTACESVMIQITLYILPPKMPFWHHSKRKIIIWWNEMLQEFFMHKHHTYSFF